MPNRDLDETYNPYKLRMTYFDLTYVFQYQSPKAPSILVKLLRVRGWYRLQDCFSCMTQKYSTQDCSL